MISNTINHCTACRFSWEPGCFVMRTCPQCGSVAIEVYAQSQWRVDKYGRVVQREYGGAYPDWECIELYERVCAEVSV
jgi:hypothetical protein